MLKSLTASVLGLLLAVLAGCAVGPDYVKPSTPTSASFVEAEQAVYAQEPVPVEFWRQFNDEILDSLIADALASNHDLRIALANLNEARTIHRESRFDLVPTVTASGGYTREQIPPAQSFGSGLTLDESYYNAGFDATWELDLFGRVRRGVQATGAEMESAEASFEDVQVSVLAEVARTYFELRGQQSELEVAERNVGNQKATRDLTTSLLDAGRGTELDTSRAQAQLSTTTATIAPLQAAIARSMHRLAVLTGREPNALAELLTPVRDLPPLPQIVAVADPAELLRRRPDIRVAERSLAAATARVGVAVGDLFPKVTFNGSFGYAGPTLNSLGGADTKTFLIGPSITWAAFDLGRVRARIAGARAADEAALAGYQKTVLTALEETENALIEHARARDRLVNLTQAATSSRTAAQIARARYEGGMVSFLEVLDAERTQLEAEDQLAESRTETATSLIALYKALGGGWQASPLVMSHASAADGRQR
jgi:multidrug efflux system outer membrane protein